KTSHQPSSQAPEKAPSPSAQATGALQAAGCMLAIVGAAGVVVGGVTGAIALSKTNSTKSDPTLCNASSCNPTGTEALRSALTFAHVSTAGFVIGGAALAGGVVLIVASPPKKEGLGAKAMLVPTLGRDGGGMTFVRAF